MSAIENSLRRRPRNSSGDDRKTVETLLPGDCRWPIGDPQHHDFHFCGEQKAEGDPYCAVHMRLGFQVKRPHVPKLTRSFIR
jgi:hypothetical protein